MPSGRTGGSITKGDLVEVLLRAQELLPDHAQHLKRGKTGLDRLNCAELLALCEVLPDPDAQHPNALSRCVHDSLLFFFHMTCLLCQCTSANASLQMRVCASLFFFNMFLLLACALPLHLHFPLFVR